MFLLCFCNTVCCVRRNLCKMAYRSIFLRRVFQCVHKAGSAVTKFISMFISDKRELFFYDLLTQRKDQMLNALLRGLTSMYLYRIGTKHSLYLPKHYHLSVRWHNNPYHKNRGFRIFFSFNGLSFEYGFGLLKAIFEMVSHISHDIAIFLKSSCGPKGVCQVWNIVPPRFIY